MARPVHPHAMTPSRPGRTRTAPPQAPSGWYTQPRMIRYLLFDDDRAIVSIYFLRSASEARSLEAQEAFVESYVACATR